MYSEEQKQIIMRAAKGVRKNVLDHIDEGFSPLQIEQIIFGIEDGLDVSTYANKSYSLEEMSRTRLILSQAVGLPYNYDSLSHKQLRRGVLFYIGTLSTKASKFFRTMYGFRLTQFRIGAVTHENIIKGIESSRNKDKSQTFYFIMLKDDLLGHAKAEVLVSNSEYSAATVQFPHLTSFEDRKDFIEDLRSKLNAQREFEQSQPLLEKIG